MYTIGNIVNWEKNELFNFIRSWYDKFAYKKTFFPTLSTKVINIKLY